MKKILIYTVENGGFVDSLYHSLGRGFEKIGRKVIYCNIDDPNFEKYISKIIQKEDIDFSVGHNEYGIIHTNNYDFLKNFYHKKEHVAILDDAPYNRITNKTFDIDCRRLLIAYRDRSHLDYLKSINLKHKALDYFFLPFGALIDKRELSSIIKDIDIIFSGMYYGEACYTWHDATIEKPLRALMDFAAKMLEEEAITVDEAISRTITNCKLQIDKEKLYPVYRSLYQYCKPYRRNKLIKTIVDSGLKLTVCSDTWKKSSFADKLDYKHANSTNDIIELYKRSKILLQDMAEFNDRSHCRIGDGALCNAMIVSEQSKFLQEKFNKSEIFFYQWNNIKTLPKSLSTLCLKDQMRNLYINSLCGNILENYLPEHRAVKIIDMVEAARKNKIL